MIACAKPPKSLPKYPVVDGVMTMPDGREICQDDAAGQREYARRREIMAERQLNRCAMCREWMLEPTFDHERSRNAGQRDDRIWKDADSPEDRQRNAALCYPCNSKKGSRRFAWVGGIYQEVKRET